MKHFVLLLLGLVFGLSMNAQTEVIPDEFVFYDTTTGAPFVYNKTLNTNQNIYGFSCPIAYNVIVSNNYLRFEITNEDFYWHIMRRTTNDYIDFYVNLQLGNYSIVNPVIPDNDNPLGDDYPIPPTPGSGPNSGWGSVPYVSQYIIRINFNR